MLLRSENYEDERNVSPPYKAAIYYTIISVKQSPNRRRLLIKMKWKDHIVRVNSISPRVAELVLCITKCYKLNIVQVYTPTPSYSQDDINSLYDGKLNHYTIMMGDFNAHIGKRINHNMNMQQANLGSN